MIHMESVTYMFLVLQLSYKTVEIDEIEILSYRFPTKWKAPAELTIEAYLQSGDLSVSHTNFVWLVYWLSRHPRIRLDARATKFVSLH